MRNEDSQHSINVASHPFGSGSVVYNPLSSATNFSQGSLSHSASRHVMPLSDLDRLPAWQPSDDPPFIPYVCWSCVVRCNLECPYCIDDKSNSESTATLRMKVAEVLAESSLLGVDISGGEPLLLRDLPDMLQTLRSSQLAISVTTNGWLLKTRAKELAGKVDAVRVSLDGVDEVEHDARRGRGSYVRAIEGIKAACEHDIPVQVQFVAMKSNIHQIGRLAANLEEEGVVGLTLLQLLPFNGGENFLHEMIGDEQLLEVQRTLRQSTKLRVYARTRRLAGGFRVIRADGTIWRNSKDASEISRSRKFEAPSDILL